MEERDGGFEEVLAQVEQALSERVAAPPLPAIGEAIHVFRDALAGADNLGASHDDRDVYVLLDRLLAAVRAAYPGVRCAEGCSGCCDSSTAIFDVWPEEWTRIEAHVSSRWTPERRAAFRARFDGEHGHRLRAYRLLGAIKHFEPVADRYWAKEGYRCPFLEDGRCAIYEARPLACRMYGFFAIRGRWLAQPSVYGCRMQADYFGDELARGGLHLPSVNAVTARVAKLTRVPRWRRATGSAAALGRQRILPLWIADRWPAVASDA